MKSRKKIIVRLALVNAITFTIARIWWGSQGELAATLEAHISDSEDKTMTYLIAGNLNQADTAFEFMESEFGPNYTFVQFSPKGWSAKATAKAIAKDIQAHGYHGRVFTISLGDHVARYLEQALGNAIEVYAINPCSGREVLQSPWGTVLRYATLPAEALCHALGWISCLPIIPSWGGQYSPMLLVDQYWSIYYDSPPMITSHTYGVICSEQDAFLDNNVIDKNYPDAEIEYIDAGHSDIVNCAEKYHIAICNLLNEE